MKLNNSKDVYLRFSIIPTIAFICLIIGFPMWIFTTSVERLNLPNEEILALDNNLFNLVNYNIPINFINLPETLNGIVGETQNLINKEIEKMDLSINFYVILKNNMIKKEDIQDEYKLELIMIDSDDGESFYVSPFDDRLIKIFISNNIIINNKVCELISKVLINDIFNDELTKINKILHKTDDENNNENLIKLNYNDNYKISINLLIAGDEIMNWEIEESLKLFKNFLKSLEKFAKFKIETQINWYEERVVNSNNEIKEVDSDDEKTENHEYNTIIIKDTSKFIDYSEWGLDQDFELDPIINFIIYIPDNEVILIENSTKNSFIVPQWGGVVIYNNMNDNGKDKHLIKNDQMIKIFEIFTSQLFQLIGGSNNIDKSPFFRIDELIRLTNLKNLINTVSNLNSLIKLTKTMETIPIPKIALIEVEECLDYLNKSLSEPSWIDGNYFSSKALKLSNKAFFQKDMVQQAYFPEEHKMAVYSPLIGPVCSIIILGLIRGIKELRMPVSNKLKTN